MDQGYVVQRIIGKRLGAKGKVEYLVKWEGYSVKQSTWEPIKHLSYVKDIIQEYEESLKAPPKTQPIHKKKGKQEKPLSRHNSESVMVEEESSSPNPEQKPLELPQKPQQKPAQPSRAGFAPPPQQSHYDQFLPSDTQQEIKVLQMKQVEGQRYFQVALPNEIKWVSNELMKKLFPGQLIAYYEKFLNIS